ncbi:hypothetical protein ACWDSJ_28230 [Nocardia sp. NPDC003482]
MTTWRPTNLALDVKDYTPLMQGRGAIIAALVGALIAGYFATRTAKHTPYERLETLLKVRQAWPVGHDGVETVDISISYALAQIRHIEADVHERETWIDSVVTAQVAQLRLRNSTRIAMASGASVALYGMALALSHHRAGAIPLTVGVFTALVMGWKLLQRKVPDWDEEEDEAMWRADLARALQEERPSPWKAGNRWGNGFLYVGRD